MKNRLCSSHVMALVAAALCVCLAPDLRASDYLSTAGVHADAYQKWIEEVTANGYRPIYVNGYNAGGKPQFAGVALKNTNGLVWEARHNLTSDEYQATFEKLVVDGYRPLTVSGYLAGKKPRFAATWVKDDKSVRWEARHNLSPQEYQDTLTAMKKDGLRPSVVAGYADGGGGYRFTVLFVKEGKTAWEARHDLTADEYQNAIDQWSAKGYRPSNVSAYETPDGPRFSIVLLKDDHPWAARHGLSGEDYQKEFDKQAAGGFRPIAVSGYRDGGETRYAAIWYKRD